MQLRYALTARAGLAASQVQTRSPAPPQLAGAQNTLIRVASILIDIQPMSAQNGGSACVSDADGASRSVMA
jgi:hypothetical protein